ncbi:hypothetical protein O181_000927 [Austropuccinia psidii MF-1]|uniref:Uncharacterized protein n=1 Tax=Austropuccinia psidii MF-1 TaxID=1389203 RepID=A0A9Q3B9L2_9BASI|nr:hypothetical protein [Austropuccinia psidii MF-1]
MNTELSRVKFKTPPKLIIQALDRLEKGPASTIHQLCSEHPPERLPILNQTSNLPNMCTLQRPRNHFTLSTLLQKLPHATKRTKTEDKKTQNSTKPKQQHFNTGMPMCLKNPRGLYYSNKNISAHQK